MKKNKTETVWWNGLTAEDMNSISKKKSPKKTSAKSREWDIAGSDCYADVVRSPKKSQKKTPESWSDEYSDVDRSKNKPKKFKK